MGYDQSKAPIGSVSRWVVCVSSKRQAITAANPRYATKEVEIRIKLIGGVPWSAWVASQVKLKSLTSEGGSSEIVSSGI